MPQGVSFFVCIFTFAKKIMAVFLFNEIIFGPVRSRRLGVSLGINLLPQESKFCNFDCIYCECGRTYKESTHTVKFPKRSEVKKELSNMLERMKTDNNPPDAITFAGNGEPTIHPEFAGIIDDTIEVRDAFFPNARIVVLSNATLIRKKSVFKALLKVDENIQKLDSAFDEKIKQLNNPAPGFTVEKLVNDLKLFKGKLVIQTMFLSGTHKGKSADNTSDAEVDAWLKLIKEVQPSKVMIYTVDRDTPSPNLKKASPEKLYEIADKVKAAGFKVHVSL